MELYDFELDEIQSLYDYPVEWDLIQEIIYLDMCSGYEDSHTLFAFRGIDDCLYVSETFSGPFCEGPDIFDFTEVTKEELAEYVRSMECEIAD